MGAWEAVDVASTDNMRACCTRIHEEFGRIDILVNNAAVGAAGALPDVTEAMFDRLFSVNVRGAFFAAQAAVAAMKLNGGGRIINISSLIAAKGVAANSHYAGAKAALIGFTRAWAVELAPFGVTVNAVLPALTPTPMTYKAFDADELSRRAAAVPMKRLGTPEDVAAAVRYFCSPGAAFVTGQSISPNGAEFVGAL
ncbi:MAG: SDR family oxidoreductase [Alphaproteobacteria bacterium]